MRQPLWTVNCALLLILFLGIYTALNVHPKIPKPVSTSAKAMLSKSKSIAPVNLKSIYEDDIFKTYIPSEYIDTSDDDNDEVEIPSPPRYHSADSYQSDGPTFLEPLPISVTGIMFLNNYSENRAIIKDNRNNEEKSYIVGDEIEDAQIVRILRNKIIIVRSNSQQETLFLREQDAILELESIDINWKEIITDNGNQEFAINQKEFVKEVRSLSDFIDRLNIITAYKEGISIGVKIGSSANKFISEAMGLQKGDIILSINDISLKSTNERFKAYKNMIDPKNTVASVKIKRNNQDILLKYVLGKKIETKVLPEEATPVIQIKEHVENKKSSFAKIANKARNKNKKNIAKFRNKISQSMPRQ